MHNFGADNEIFSKNDFLNYVNGEWVPAEGQLKFEKLNPFSGQVLGQVAQSEAMDVIKALPSAKQAQQNFEKTLKSERAQILLAIASALEANEDKFALLEATHQGLSKKFVLEKSVRAAIWFFRNSAIECEALADGVHIAAPVGLVSILTSWALSLRLISERLAPALAAGNGVFIKISELSPITGNILGEVLSLAGVPPGLVQIFQGKGDGIGQILSAHPSIRAVSFVGKTTTAEQVIRAALGTHKKIQIAGGAKNSCLVLQGTDFQSLMPQILESFLMGQGQICWNSHRLFLPEAISAEFISAMKAYLEKLQPAKDALSDSHWMPLIESSKIEKLESQTSLAQQEHAKLICGSDQAVATEGFFTPPCFTVDLTNCSAMQQDEIGGPLFIVTSVKYQHEMLKWSNTGYFGHSAIVWGPGEKFLKAASALQSSYVWSNAWLTNQDPIPGQKQSSYGNPDLRAFGSFFSDVKKLTIS